MLGLADARKHEGLWRVDRAGREHDLALSVGANPIAADLELHAGRAVAVERDLCRSSRRSNSTRRGSSPAASRVRARSSRPGVRCRTPSRSSSETVRGTRPGCRSRVARWVRRLRATVPTFCVRTQTVREHAARRSCADDDVVAGGGFRCHRQRSSQSPFTLRTTDGVAFLDRGSIVPLARCSPNARSNVGDRPSGGWWTMASRIALGQWLQASTLGSDPIAVVSQSLPGVFILVPP